MRDGCHAAFAAGWLTVFLAAPPAGADETRGAAELSYGHESLSAPLIRLSENGALFFADGLTRLSGDFARLAASAMHDWAFADGARLALSGQTDWKRAPGAPDLDFGMTAADLIWRQAVGPDTLGVGPTLQRLWVAGRRFRDVGGIQADWTRVDAGGHWMAVGEIAANRHGGEDRDFDATVALFTAQRHLALPASAVDALDLEVGAVREHNTRGFAELSNRGVYARASADLRMASTTVSAGVMVQATRFDASAFAGVPARQDRYRAIELSVSHEFSGGINLRFDLTDGRNHANSPLYESRNRLAGLTLSAQW